MYTTLFFMTKRKLSKFIKMYGPVKGPINRQRVQELLNQGKNEFILSIVEGDSNTTLYGCPGNHFVNVLDKYEFEQPLPQDVLVFDIHFGDSGLPS